MDLNLWISVLLAIPLAVVANLLTPRLRSWLDARSERSKRKKTEEKIDRQRQQLEAVRHELEEISGFHADRGSYHQYLLVTLLRIALYGSIGGIYGGVLSLMGQLVDFAGALGRVAILGAQATSMLVAMMVLTMCLRALRTYAKVKTFGQFKSDTEKQIAELEDRIGQQSPAGAVLKAAPEE